MRQIFTFLFLLACTAHTHAQVIFKSIDLVRGSSEPGKGTGLFIYNTSMYFPATDSTYGTELWVSDGTQAGSKMLVDLNPGATGSNPCNFIVYNGKMFFQTFSPTADTLQIWSSDGTATGTQLVKTIAVSDTFVMHAPDHKFTLCNGKLYFVAPASGIGFELWISDGTDAGTHMVKDINPSKDFIFNNYMPQYITAYNNKVYFLADDSVHGKEMWVSDGTEAGTQILIDLNPGVQQSYVSPPFEYSGKLYFYGYEPVYGGELRITDGTPAGTQLFKDFVPGAGSSGGWNQLNSGYAIFNGKLYLGNARDTTTFLWVSDGTVAGTQVLDSFALGYSPGSFNIFNGRLYFNAATSTIINTPNPQHVTGLWCTDGTPGGSKLIVDNFTAGVFTVYRNKAYFQQANYYSDMYVTDGTTKGTNKMPAAIKGLAIDMPFTVYQDKMYFPSNKESSIGTELWYVEGYFPISVNEVTTENTLQIYPNPNSGNFTIKVSGYSAGDNTVISVYDMMGRLVYTQKLNAATVQLQLGDLPKGLYEVKLQQGNLSSSTKIMIE